MTVELHRRFARNNAWSNHRLLKACAGLSEEAYRARRTSFFPSIELTLNHILIVDLLYYDVVAETGNELSRHHLPDVPWPSFAELDAAQRASDRALIAFCDGLSEADLDRTVMCERPNGRFPDKIGAFLSHLFVHQIHHRGQVHAMLTQAGITPPPLDIINFEGARR